MCVASTTTEGCMVMAANPAYNHPHGLIEAKHSR